MNTKKNTTIQKSKMKMTASRLMRLAGLSAMVAGLCFVIVGMFHQENIPSSVTTATWANVHIAAVAMGFFGLFGMVGIYVRQAEKAGWLGLVGFVLFSLWLALIMPLSFVEAFILPQLATELPKFVTGFLGMFSGAVSEVDLGLLPTLWNISGPMFIFGPMLFGIATFRAGVLPRWAGGLLVIGSVLVPVAALVPPVYESLVMVPHGLALAWLGYALFSERREKTSETFSDQKVIAPESGQVA